MTHKTSKLFLIMLSALALASGLRAGPSAADVGDADSFGANAKYMGAASSGFLRLSPDCAAEPSPSPGPPDSQCTTLAPTPAETDFDFQDVCRIKLPKNSTKDIIYTAFTFRHNFQFRNLTGVRQPQAFFTYTPSVTIDSTALNDPSVIDPQTGMPAMGRLLKVPVSPVVFRDDESLEIDQRIRHNMTYSRTGIAGINRMFLINYGVPAAVVDQMFKNEMTIRMNVEGSAKLVTDALLGMHMRLFGD